MRSFIDLCSQSFGFFSFNHTAFIISLFTFILLCNCIAIIPWVEEPTKELNTTLALGILSFLYIQCMQSKRMDSWLFKRIFCAIFFHVSIACDWQTINGRFNIIPFIWQYFWRRYHYSYLYDGASNLMDF